MAGEASAEALRTRYYDWCSAKVAAHFLSLSPEDVWHRAMLAREAPKPVGTADEESGFFAAGTSFDLIRLLAHQLADELELPPLEMWAEEYRQDPERFEQEILRVSAETEPDSLHPSS
jgi:lambda repressor-like predicted transcriptional regulator